VRRGRTLSRRLSDAVEYAAANPATQRGTDRALETDEEVSVNHNVQIEYCTS